MAFFLRKQDEQAESRRRQALRNSKVKVHHFFRKKTLEKVWQHTRKTRLISMSKVIHVYHYIEREIIFYSHHYHV